MIPPFGKMRGAYNYKRRDFDRVKLRVNAYAICNIHLT